MVLDIADRAAALERGEVDVVVDHFTVTCARQRTVEFSTPYLPATQRLLVPIGSGVREVEDLAGQRVCTSRGSTTEDSLRALPVKLDVLTLRGIPDCVVALERGQVAAVSSDDVILAGLAVQDPQTEIVGRPLAQAAYGVGMRPDQPDLVRFVNAVLERSRATAASPRATSGGWVAFSTRSRAPARPLPRLTARRIGGREGRGGREGDRGPRPEPDDGAVGSGTGVCGRIGPSSTASVVPLLEPRSTRSQPSERATRSACAADTAGSSSARSMSGAVPRVRLRRPIVIRSPDST